MNRELERADIVLCPSKFVRDTMVTNGVPADKCWINPFGVDTSIFRPAPEPPAAPRFICVGTICLRKGHQYLFRAFEQVKRAVPAAELVCVGPFKADFRKERPRWEGLFEHHLSLTHAELAKLLQTCSVFVLTSVEEGFARVIPEAMAAGLPILTTYETGATTFVQDGVEGLIVPSCNPTATAEAMIQLARDPALRRKMGQAAYQAGAANNTWQDYGDRMLEEYRRRRGLKPEMNPDNRVGQVTIGGAAANLAT
jgi:glycosyltransferase involved in cell wall biosynthesis